MKNELNEIEVYGVLEEKFSNSHCVSRQAHCFIPLETANVVYEYLAAKPADMYTIVSLIKSKIKVDHIGNQERMDHQLLAKVYDSEYVEFVVTSKGAKGIQSTQVNTLALEAERQEALRQ